MANLNTACALSAMLAIAACSSKEQPMDEGVPPEPVATQGSESPVGSSEPERLQPSSAAAKQIGQGKPPGETLSDSEIARITDAVNSGEIAQAQVAKDKASSPQVEQFAEEMIRDHRQAKEQSAMVVKEAGIIPEESATATELSDESARTLAQLRAADPGAGFDALYMSGQVTVHAKVLDLLDTQLIPSANDPSLKAELQKARGMVQRHLNHAREIQTGLED